MPRANKQRVTASSRFLSGKMQPFSVTCETCGARLKVRDESLLGEIHSCPRCASMVLIMLPEGTAADSALSAIPATSSHVEEASATHKNQPLESDFSAQVDGLLQQGASADTSQSLDAAPAKPASVDSSLATGASSSVVLWSAISATTLVVLVLGGFAWWSSGENSIDSAVATSTLQSSPDTSAPEPTPDHTEVNDLVEPESAPSDAAAAPTEPQPTEVQKPEIKTANEVPPLPPVTSTELPTVPPDEAAQESESEGAPGGDRPTVAFTPTDTRPTIPSFIDPLGIDPADLDLLLVPKQPASSAAPSESEVTPRGEANPVTVPGDVPLEQPQQKRRFDPGSAALGPSFAGQGPSTPLAARMAARIPSIRWSKTPLHRVLSELSQLSGVTIQIDPDTLRMAPARATFPITYSQQDVAVESIVAGLAESLQLEVVAAGDLLYLSKPGADATREVSYPVDDLVKGDAATQELVKLIEQFALEAPEGAEIKVVDGQIVIRQPARHQYDVLLFLERLRKSRGLAPRMRYPAELVSAEPKLLSLHEKLSRSATFAIVDWTPLTDAVDFWQESCGVAILVDWRELATVDRHPFSTLAASANHLPWSQALDACLMPLEMAWIPIDGESIQLTSREGALRHQWVEFYPAQNLSQLPPRSRTAEGLRELLADKCDPQSVGVTILADDAAGKQVVVRGNREIHQAILELRNDS